MSIKSLLTAENQWKIQRQSINMIENCAMAMQHARQVDFATYKDKGTLFDNRSIQMDNVIAVVLIWYKQWTEHISLVSIQEDN